jgi:protein-S-isoprenylcysteine O-methyltransferase Ste14
VADPKPEEHLVPAEGFPPDVAPVAGPVPQGPLKRILDLGERAFSLALFAALVARLAPTLPTRPWNGLLLVSEGLVVFFMIIRRRPQLVTSRPLDWLAAFLGTAAPLLVRPGGHPLGPPAVGGTLILVGLVVSIWAKLTLRRSFGLAAANRGVVGAGLYGLVRHPMYAGYLMVYAGFFLLNPLAWNAGIYLLTIAFLVFRLMAEERLLAKDPHYLAFMGRVRYRLAPGLF